MGGNRMVHISIETPAETHTRLQGVLKRATMKLYSETYTFIECPMTDFPAALQKDALACVRDDSVWSQLVPGENPQQERFRIIRFHFDPILDNSGFVGWLASHLKARLGTGVFVVCGQNSQDGGIFDYWGIPHHLVDDVLLEIKELMHSQCV